MTMRPVERLNVSQQVRTETARRGSGVDHTGSHNQGLGLDLILNIMIHFCKLLSKGVKWLGYTFLDLWLLFEELTMGQRDQLGYKRKPFKQEGKGLDLNGHGVSNLEASPLWWVLSRDHCSSFLFFSSRVWSNVWNTVTSESICWISEWMNE